MPDAQRRGLENLRTIKEMMSSSHGEHDRHRAREAGRDQGFFVEAVAVLRRSEIVRFGDGLALANVFSVGPPGG